MITEDIFYGGADSMSIPTGTHTLERPDKRLQLLTPQLDGVSIKLPDAREMREGGPIYYLINLHATFIINVKNNDETLLGVLAGDKCFTMVLADISTAAGNWRFRESTAYS